MSNQPDQNNKPSRGRPKGSPNKLKSVTTLAKNRELAREEVKRLINLFVIRKMQKIDDLYDSLGTRDQGKMLTELLKYSTPTSGKDVEILSKENEQPKQITSIKVVYQKAGKDDDTILDITPKEDIDNMISDHAEEADYYDNGKDYDEDE